ncbi:MAG: 5'-nucleotidase C-terminal domain-containing protein [Solibacillus sp.]
MFLGTKKGKAFMKATTAVAMVASAVVTVPALTEASGFKDVPSSHQFYAEIINLQQRGIINGFPDGTYKASESVTRGQAAKIIAGVLGLNTTNVTNPNFKDIPTAHQYYGAIAALKQAGIINGFPDGTYGANEPIQRNHIAKILTNAFELKAADTALPFTDIRAEYRTSIAALYEHNITTGTTATTYGGASFVTRGQLAAFITRAERVGTENPPIKEPVKENKELSFTLESLPTNGKVTVAGKTYTVAEPLTSIFAKTNEKALTNAAVKATVDQGVIVSIDELTLNRAGTASLPVSFTTSATIGALTVNADYVYVKNAKVTKNVTLTLAAATTVKLEGTTIGGKLVVERTAKTASVTPVANTLQSLTVTLTNTTLQQAVIARDQTKIITDQKLPQLTISAGVQTIDSNGPIGKVTVEATGKMSWTGKSSVDEITVNAATELTLGLEGVIAKLTITNPNAKITLAPNVKITNLVLPEGKTAADIIVNYQTVASQIGGSTPATGGSGSGGSSRPVKGDFTLSVMHNNDTHANLDNLPKTVTAIKEYRAQKPNALLLNAGDVFSGTLYFNTFEGKADLAMLKLMGYDAMTFGNHEFDLGSSKEGHQALVDFVKGANFPFVSSNVDFSADSRFTGLFTDLISSDPQAGKIYNGIVKVINGEKVGIFGLTTEETKGISSPGAVTFENYLTEAEKAVKAFQGMGVDKIIALTHLGYDDNAAVDNDLTLAAKVDGIDLIVGGHSHTTLKEPVVINQDENGGAKEPTVIVQANEYNKFLGTVDVKFNNKGVVVDVDGQLIEIGKQVEDAKAVEVLKPFKDEVEKISNSELGVTLAAALENPRANATSSISVRANETILGNIITDGMLAKAKQYDKDVVLALQNGGGIRAPIDAGPVTVGEVITVLPFGNTLATMSITGEQLKAAFEISFKSYPGESGGFLHMAGGKVEFDSTKPAGARVVAIYVNNGGTLTKLEDNKTYKVATNAFTAKGGDSYTVFEELYKAGKVTDLGLSDWENLREHLLSIKEAIPTKLEGRIVDVSLVKTVPAEELQGGTEANPIVISGDAIVNLSDVEKIEHVVFEGNLTLTGTVSNTMVLSDVKVNGHLNVTAVQGEVALDGIEAGSVEL